MKQTEIIDVLIPSFRDLAYVYECIAHLQASSICSDLNVVVLNNDNKIHQNDFKIEQGDLRSLIIIDIGYNSGYGYALNKGISLTNSNYIFVCNSDVFVDKTYLEKLINFFKDKEEVGQITGKILRYDFRKHKKTDIIDTTGLVMYRNRRVVDRGAGEVDKGQFFDGDVFGISGAATLIKRHALSTICIDGEYYDENMFMYKEDVDLSWRLLLAGWKSYYFKDAIAYHCRTSTGLEDKPYLTNITSFIDNESRKKEYVKIQSMKNQWLLLIKNEQAQNAIIDGIFIVFREGLVLIHNLIFSPKLSFISIKMFYFQLSSTLKKRRLIQSKSKLSANEFRRLLS